MRWGVEMLCALCTEGEKPVYRRSRHLSLKCKAAIEQFLKNDSWYLTNHESKKMIFCTTAQSSSRGAKKLAIALNLISMSWTWARLIVVSTGKSVKWLQTLKITHSELRRLKQRLCQVKLESQKLFWVYKDISKSLSRPDSFRSVYCINYSAWLTSKVTQCLWYFKPPFKMCWQWQVVLPL